MTFYTVARRLANVPCALAQAASARSRDASPCLATILRIWTLCGKFDQEFGIALQVMDAPWILPGETRHRIHILPVGNGDEFAFLRTVLSQHFDAKSLFLERTDTFLIEIFGVFIRPVSLGPAAPNTSDGGIGRSMIETLSR